jgi:hypothetical protein
MKLPEKKYGQNKGDKKQNRKRRKENITLSQKIKIGEKKL